MGEVLHLFWSCFRNVYVAAGVFSKCILDSADCCLDPVVYTRVATLAHWIRENAPGVRSSEGCPMKPVRGYKIYKIIHTSYILAFFSLYV